MLRCFLRVVCLEATSRFANGRINSTCESHGATVSLRDCIWKLPLKSCILRLMEHFDVDPVLGMLAIARLYEVVSGAKACLGCNPYSFAISVVKRAPEYTDISRGGLFLCLEIRVLFGADWSREIIRPYFAEAVLSQYKANGDRINAIPSLVESLALVSAMSDTDEASMSVVGGPPGDEVAEANVDLPRSLADVDKDWYLKEMTTAEEGEKTRLVVDFEKYEINVAMFTWKLRTK